MQVFRQIDGIHSDNNSTVCFVFYAENKEETNRPSYVLKVDPPQDSPGDSPGDPPENSNSGKYTVVFHVK